MSLRRFYGLLCAALLGLIGLSLCLGVVHFSPLQLLQLLTFSSDSTESMIVWQLRLPRILLALALGGLLALSGLACQSLFRNSLADPSLLGVSAGASLGAALVVLLGLALSVPAGFGALSVGALLGSLAVMLLVLVLAGLWQGGLAPRSPSSLMLMGVALSYLAGSCTSAIYYALDLSALRQMLLWSQGGIEQATGLQAGLAWGIFGLATGLLWRRRLALNALLLGEAEASALGIPVSRLRVQLIAIICTLVATSVVLGGIIAFIGLVVPHLARLCLGAEHRRLIPAVAVLGAFLLLLADTLARTLIAPAELPVGLVTALLGAPVFLLLLWRQGGQLA